MPFESAENGVVGTFIYDTLLERIKAIRIRLDDETDGWVQRGKESFEVGEGIAANLKSQFHQCQRWYEANPDGVTVTLEMEKDNPFVWTMVWTLLSLKIYVSSISLFPIFCDHILCCCSSSLRLSFPLLLFYFI
jgi:hypothetical protein